MSVTNLRRSGSIDARIVESLKEGSHDNLRIDCVEIRDWSPIISDHPFPEQTIVDGVAIYDEPSTFTEGREIKVDFEIRTGSRLILFEYQTDLSSLEPVTEQLRQVVDDNLSIYHSLHAPEDALWDFLTTANRIIEIDVLNNGAEVPYSEVENTPVADVIGNFAISQAKVGFDYNNEQILVSFREGKLQIESDIEESREYIIQLFEREVLGSV